MRFFKEKIGRERVKLEQAESNLKQEAETGDGQWREVSSTFALMYCLSCHPFFSIKFNVGRLSVNIQTDKFETYKTLV